MTHGFGRPQAPPRLQLSQPPKDSSYLENQRVVNLCVTSNICYCTSYISLKDVYGSPLASGNGRPWPLRAASERKSLFQLICLLHILHTVSRESIFHNKNLMSLNPPFPLKIPVASQCSKEKVQNPSHGLQGIAQFGIYIYLHLLPLHPPTSSSLSTFQPLSGIIYAPHPHLGAWPGCPGGCFYLLYLFP